MIIMLLFQLQILYIAAAQQLMSSGYYTILIVF